MFPLLAIAILVIGGLFTALTILIVANKMWRESNAAYERMRRRDVEPDLLRYAHGEERSLLAALGEVPIRRDRRVIRDLLLEHVQRVRGIEHDRLARALDELGFVDEMLADLGHGHWWRRAAAAENLGLAGARRAAAALTRAMNDDSLDVRMRAAKSLGALGGSASIRALVGVMNEPDRWSTIRVADILAGMGPPVVDELIGAFDGLAKAGRLSTMDILGRARPVDRRPWIEERTRDRDADVRARACHALGRIGDPQALPALVERLADEAWPVRAMAAKALGWLGSDAAVVPLSGAMRDPEWWVRSNAAHALQAIGNAGLAILETMAGDHDAYARHQAIQMLEEAGVVDRHAAELAGDDAARVDAARSFLRKVIEAGQTQRLRALAAAHPADSVRRRLTAMLPASEDEAA